MSTYTQCTGTQRMRKEDNFEQYFIVPDVMEACVETVKETFAGERFDTIIDPCVGPATYLPFIRKNFRSVSDIRCSDIDPKEEWIEQRDFLKDPHFTEQPDKKILTFCNPPFGGLKLSNGFISNVLQFSDAAAFIIPHSYKNHDRTLTLAKDLCWRIVREIDLPEEIFTVNGKPFAWKCILQIWKRGTSPRRQGRLEEATPNGYKIVSAPTSKEGAHLWMHTLGDKAGKIGTKGSRGSRWGLKFKLPHFKTHESKQRMRLLINNCGGFSTYGSRSRISRPDVVRRLNVLVDYFVTTNVADE